jgi:hypothetical protein
MANTKRFGVLKARLKQLRTSLLPKVYSPTGYYNQATLDKARGFRLLAHAEFESFLEDIIRLYVAKSVMAWNTRKKTSTPLLCILASYPGAELINNYSKYPAKTPITLSTLINKSFVHFEHNVTNNNGVRTENVLSLLVQVGLNDTLIDSVWLGTVDAFGAHRNVVAHNTGAVGFVSYQTDPKTTEIEALSICDGLRDLDERLRQMYQRI